MKQPKPRAVGPMATQESALTSGVAASVMAAASAAIPPGQGVQFMPPPPPNPHIQMAAPSLEALGAQGAAADALGDGIIMNEHAAAKLGLRRAPMIEPKIVPHKFAHFQVFGKNELLGTVTRAVDESDAIGQMVKAYKIVGTEQWMFVAKKIPGTEYTL